MAQLDDKPVVQEGPGILETEQEQEQGKSEQEVEQGCVKDKSKLEQFEDPDEGLSEEERTKGGGFI